MIGGTPSNPAADLFAAQDTVTVGIVSATNAVPVNTQSVTSYLVSPNVPVVFSAQDTQVVEGGVAEVQIKINQAPNFPVSVQYVTVDGSATNGTSYTGQTTPVRITFAKGADRADDFDPDEGQYHEFQSGVARILHRTGEPVAERAGERPPSVWASWSPTIRPRPTPPR